MKVHPVLVAFIVVTSISFSAIAAPQVPEVKSSSVDCYTDNSGNLIEEYTYTLTHEATVTEVAIFRTANGEQLNSSWKVQESMLIDKSREMQINLSASAPLVMDILIRDSESGQKIARLKAPEECLTKSREEFKNKVERLNLNEFGKVQQRFIQYLNQERQQAKVQNVSQRSVLTQMGRNHSQHMVEYNYFSHEEPDWVNDPNHGDTIRDRYEKRGLLPECKLPIEGSNRYYLGAENIAMVFLGSEKITSERDFAQALFDQWYNSEGHRKVMLLASADQVGLGIAINNSTGFAKASLELC